MCCVLLLLNRPGLLLLPGCCPGAVLAGVAGIILLRGRGRAVCQLSERVHSGSVVLQNAGICCLGRVLLAGLELKLLAKICLTGTQAQLAKKRQKQSDRWTSSRLVLVVAATRAANQQQIRCIVWHLDRSQSDIEAQLSNVFDLKQSCGVQVFLAIGLPDPLWGSGFSGSWSV